MNETKPGEMGGDSLAAIDIANRQVAGSIPAGGSGNSPRIRHFEDCPVPIGVRRCRQSSENAGRDFGESQGADAA
jgi:hypothetical protein